MSKSVANPFRGLRPFEVQESHLFFGRESEFADLESDLRINRFLAVVGTSGSGKSSLVRAGLVPRLLESGEWRVASMRPGDDPIEALADALNECSKDGDSGYWQSDESPPNEGRFTQSTLKQGSMGLIEVISEFSVPEKTLIFVDQFEEIFRFSEQRSDLSDDDAKDFVHLLLEAIRQSEQPIYVCLTMRSDFLGQCPLFPGLPEALNSAQYLVPRLGRRNLRDVIRKPVQQLGYDLTPRLVTKILNELVESQDQLPLLQHALQQTFDNWQDDDASEALDIQHYSGMGNALSNHLDSILDSFNDQQKQIAEQLFKLLTTIGTSGNAVRRPCRFEEICAVCTGSEADILHVIDAFRQEGHTFLMPPIKEQITKDTILDLTHESLIRVWPKVRDEWVPEESERAKRYLRLVEDTLGWQNNTKGLLDSLEIGIYSNWREETKPSQSWANRYGGELLPALSYLNESTETNQTMKRRRYLLIALVVVFGFASTFIYQRDRAADLRADLKVAQEQLERAEEIRRLRYSGIASTLSKDYSDYISSSTREEREKWFRMMAHLANEQGEINGHKDVLKALNLLSQLKPQIQNKPAIATHISQELSLTLEKIELTNERFAESELKTHIQERQQELVTLLPREPVLTLPGGLAETIIAGSQQDVIVAVSGYNLPGCFAIRRYKDPFSADEDYLEQATNYETYLNPDAADIPCYDDRALVALEVFNGAEQERFLVAGYADGDILVWDVNVYEAPTFRLNARQAFDNVDESDTEAKHKITALALAPVIEENLPSDCSERIPFDLFVGTNTGEIVQWDRCRQVSFYDDPKSQKSITAIAVNSDWLATGSNDKYVNLYALTQREGVISDGSQNPEKKLNTTEWTTNLEFIPNENTLMVSTFDKKISQWEANSGFESASLDMSSHWKYVRDVELAPNGNNILSAGRDGIVQSWSVETQKPTEAFRANIAGLDRVKDARAFGERRILTSSYASRPSAPRKTHLWRLDELKFEAFDQPTRVADRLKFNLASQMQSDLALKETIEAYRFYLNKLRTKPKADESKGHALTYEGYIEGRDLSAQNILQAFNQEDAWEDRWEIYRSLRSQKSSGLEELAKQSSWQTMEDNYNQLLSIQGSKMSLGTALAALHNAGEDDSLKTAIQSLVSIRSSQNEETRGMYAKAALDASDNEVVVTLLQELGIENIEDLEQYEELSYEKKRSSRLLTLEDRIAQIDESGIATRELNDLWSLVRYGQNKKNESDKRDLIDLVTKLSNQDVKQFGSQICSWLTEDKVRKVAELKTRHDSALCKGYRLDRYNSRALPDDLRRKSMELLSEAGSGKRSHWLAYQAATVAFEFLNKGDHHTASHFARKSIGYVDNEVGQTVLDQLSKFIVASPSAQFETGCDIKVVRYTTAGDILAAGASPDLHRFNRDGTQIRFKKSFGAECDSEGEAANNATYSIVETPEGFLFAGTAGWIQVLSQDFTKLVEERKTSCRNVFELSPNPVDSKALKVGFTNCIEVLSSDAESRKISGAATAEWLADGKLLVGNRYGDLNWQSLNTETNRYENTGRIVKAFTNLPVSYLWVSGNHIFAVTNPRATTLKTSQLKWFDSEGTELGHLTGLPYVRNIEFDQRSNSIFVASYDGSIREYGLDGKLLLQFMADGERVYSVDLHPTKPRVILTGGNDGIAKEWSLDQLTTNTKADDAGISAEDVMMSTIIFDSDAFMALSEKDQIQFSSKFYYKYRDHFRNNPFLKEDAEKVLQQLSKMESKGVASWIKNYEYSLRK